MGSSSLDSMILRVQGLSKGFAEAVAQEAGPAIENAVKAAAAAGTDINGTAWANRKDGSRALPDVAKDLSVKVLGTIIQIQLTGGSYWHQRAKGTETRPQRQILPDTGNGAPEALTSIVEKAAAKTFRRLMGG